MFAPTPAITHTRSGMASRHMPIFQSWALVVVSALALGTAAQVVGPRRIPWVEDHSRRVEWKAAQIGMEIVDVEGAKEIVEKGEFLVCDARKMEEFDAGHLPGAVSFPFASHEEAYNELAALFSEVQPVMVYCSGRDCDDALLLGKFLRAQGTKRVVLFLDGISGWREAGLPLD
ncbi:MAG: rhodanese-like domain-containing protein [Terrimicrobiaceae bacterium]